MGSEMGMGVNVGLPLKTPLILVTEALSILKSKSVLVLEEARAVSNLEDARVWLNEVQ
jgi:hypothetical protein